MKKLVFKIIIPLLLILVFSSISLSKVTFASSGGSYVVVFKENKIPLEIKNFLQRDYPEVKTTTISEIGTIKLEYSRDGFQEKAIEEMKKFYIDKIEYISQESKINLPKDINNKKNHLINYTNQNIVNVIPNLRRNNDYELSKNTVKNGELSKALGWDTDKVTSQGKSYQKQPGDHSIKIAIIDSGVDFNHPDLKENIISQGRSFVPNVSDTGDNMGHGTMTAGAIAANGKMLGIGPNLGIIPYKVMDNWEDGAESVWVIQAILAAANDNVDVINLSLGTYKSLNKKEDLAIVEGYSRALKYAHKKGTIIVASAGNEGYNISNPSNLAIQMGLEGDRQIHLPGTSSSYLINVSATNKSEELSSYSNFGGITVAAPGGDFGEDWPNSVDPSELVLVTYPTNLPQPYISQVLNLPIGYTLSGGTSLAAPKVAGAVGVLLAEGKKKNVRNLSINKVENIFRKSSLDLGEKGKDEQFGYGRLDLNKAIDLVK
ncbi:S8 family serine peptidase [Priestia flexa]|uniref:S8 family serine peptidase n=1 Tax=Priestia flexa TaxID=86664 RepID=UPI000957286D|nr:S8 family serine peptidase [Priestia flexa]SIQ61566.1 Subtilase family protein [Priestia flexa]